MCRVGKRRDADSYLGDRRHYNDDEGDNDDEGGNEIGNC